jgi:hypothetical protein
LTVEVVLRVVVPVPVPVIVPLTFDADDISSTMIDALVEDVPHHPTELTLVIGATNKIRTHANKELVVVVVIVEIFMIA